MLDIFALMVLAVLVGNALFMLLLWAVDRFRSHSGALYGGHAQPHHPWQEPPQTMQVGDIGGLIEKW